MSNACAICPAHIERRVSSASHPVVSKQGYETSIKASMMPDRRLQFSRSPPSFTIVDRSIVRPSSVTRFPVREMCSHQIMLKPATSVSRAALELMRGERALQDLLPYSGRTPSIVSARASHSTQQERATRSTSIHIVTLQICGQIAEATN